MVDIEVYRGVPSLALMPAKNYSFTIIGKHRITLPKSGKYIELDPSFYKEEDGDFDLFIDDKVFNSLEFSKVLFAMKKYPNLEGNQLFLPTVIALDGDKVEIIGQIIEMV